MYEIIDSFISYLKPIVIVTGFAIFYYLVKFRILHFKQEDYDMLDYLKDHKNFILSIILFLACVTSLEALNDKENKLYKNEITHKVEQIADKDYAVSINNISVPKNESLIKALKNIRHSTGNKPDNSNTIYLKITYKDIFITLRLSRDSYIKTKYWVYHNARKSEMAIGEIQTSYFNKYR